MWCFLDIDIRKILAVVRASIGDNKLTNLYIKMKLFVVFCAFIAVGSCAPSVNSEIAARRALPALEHEEIHDEFGQYALRYVTAEGTVVSERGRLVPTAKGDYVLVTEGEVSYIGDDGELYISKFSAGIDGYHVINTHQPLSINPAQVDARAQ